MLVPTESEMGQLVVFVQVAEQWLAAVVAVHFSDPLARLVIPSCFRHPGPILRAAAVEILCAASAGIGIGGVGCLQV